MNVQKVALSGLTLCVLVSALSPMAEARRHHRHYGYDRRPTYFSQHPYVKGGLVGAGVGAGAGALLSRDGRRMDGATKGAVLGGAAGVGLQYLNRH